MLYFAYGSNLDWQQIKRRCPSASFFCIAMLLNYRLEFTHYSDVEHRKCWVADIVPADKENVWGVVYRLDEADIGNLDKNEGYKPQRAKNSYLRKEIMVYKDGNKEFPITAWTYEVMDKILKNNKTSETYKQQIINGADLWHLPFDYIEKLKQIEVQ